MVVHFVSSGSDFARGRFLGPAALLRQLESLLPDLTPQACGPSEWRPCIDLMEGAGLITPVVRWRVPAPVLRRLWADHDGRQPGPEETGAEVEQSLSALRSWYLAQACWGRQGFATQHDHPLDTLPEGAAEFLEHPAEHPWTATTYEPTLIRTRPGGLTFRDREACVPLFRAWQVLHLAELSIGEPRHFAGLLGGSLAGTPAGGLAPRRWEPQSDAEGFARHRPILEALSWYDAYTNHALMLTETPPPERGMFRAATTALPARDGLFEIRGTALQALRTAEARVARDALVRHGVDHDAMLRGAAWLGKVGVRRRRSGHEAVAKAHADLMRQAIELLMDDGLELRDIKTRLGEGDRYLELLFPSWIGGRRDLLRLELEAVVGAFGHWPDPIFPVFDGNLADGFVGWLEKEELLGAHMAVGALAEYGHRPGTDTDVGTAFHVASLAAWVEHVCNALLGPDAAPGDTLDRKLPGCWAGHAHEGRFRSEWGGRAVPRGVTGLRDRVAHVLLVPPADRVGWAARDARLAQVIRNAGLHSGFGNLTRSEAHGAAHLLLCVAVHAWLLRR